MIFLAENAWEELETWLLAGLEPAQCLELGRCREEVHVKETYSLMTCCAMIVVLSNSLEMVAVKAFGREAATSCRSHSTEVSVTSMSLGNGLRGWRELRDLPLGGFDSADWSLLSSGTMPTAVGIDSKINGDFELQGSR